MVCFCRHYFFFWHGITYLAARYHNSQTVNMNLQRHENATFERCVEVSSIRLHFAALQRFRTAKILLHHKPSFWQIIISKMNAFWISRPVPYYTGNLVPCLITQVIPPKFRRKLCIVFALKMEAADSIQTLVLFYKTTLCHIQQDYYRSQKIQTSSIFI